MGLKMMFAPVFLLASAALLGGCDSREIEPPKSMTRVELNDIKVSKLSDVQAIPLHGKQYMVLRPITTSDPLGSANEYLRLTTTTLASSFGFEGDQGKRAAAECIIGPDYSIVVDSVPGMRELYGVPENYNLVVCQGPSTLSARPILVHRPSYDRMLAEIRAAKDGGGGEGVFGPEGSILFFGTLDSRGIPGSRAEYLMPDKWLYLGRRNDLMAMGMEAWKVYEGLCKFKLIRYCVG